MEQNKVDDKNIDKKVFVFSIFLLGLIILMSITLCYFLLSEKILDISYNSSNDTSIEVNQNIDTAIKETINYQIKEYNGKIAVYKNDSLIYTLDTFVFTLPESDKELLKNGITVNTIDELTKIIEEYS